MERNPVISIVVSNYNYERYVCDAVDSALAQTGVPVEVIVVDDGSTDSSLQALGRYGDRIVLVAQQNTGQGGAFNTGISKVRGSIVCLLDADDIMLPQRALRVMEAAQANPEAGVFVHRVKNVNASRHALGDPWPASIPPGSLGPLLDRSGGYWPCPPTSGLAFRSDVVRRLLPIPEQQWRICADAYLVALAPYIAPVAVIDEPLTEYRIHASNNWVASASSGEESPAAIAARARALADRAQAVLESAARLGVRLNWSLADNFAYQFSMAQLGSLSACIHLVRIAASSTPFVSRIDSLKAPIAALRRFVLHARRSRSALSAALADARPRRVKS